MLTVWLFMYHNIAIMADPSEEEAAERPYETSLDFLDDYFQLITEQIKLSRERLKRKMKDAVGEVRSFCSKRDIVSF